MIVGLWMWIIFCSCRFVSWAVCFVLAALCNGIQDVVGDVTLSQPSGGKDSPKNDPITTKAQLQPDISYKCHKWHLKSIQLRIWRRLHQWVPQVFYHRRSHHEDKEWKQIKLIHRKKKRRVTWNGETKKQSPIERKRGIPRKSAKLHWGKQTIRHWVQNNGYKGASMCSVEW